MNREALSYSGMTKFCNCRRAYYWRYIEQIEPNYITDALSFGKLIHACLEALYSGKEYYSLINDNYKDLERGNNAHHKALAMAMMTGYKDRYLEQDKDLKILATEFEFECDIINPNTGRKSRKYKLRGFIDKVVERPDGIWLHEYKTTALLNDGYISRVWHNLQEIIYIIAYERVTGNKVKGIIHDAIQKVKLKQGKKETTPEFTARLQDRYLTDKSLFHREEILKDNRRVLEVENEIWQVTQDIGKCKDFYKNRSQCYGFYECDFFKICNSNDNPLIIQNYYKEREDDITNGKTEKEQQPF